MSGSSTIVLVVGEFIGLGIICGFLLRYFQSHMVSTDVKIAVYLSWVMGLSGILLLPYDVSLSILHNHNRNISFEIVWKIIYWR